MRDPDDLLRALESPDPPDEAPPWPVERRSRLGWAVALAAAAVVALFLGVRAPETPTTRGADASPPTLDLRMAVERDGVAERVATGAVLRRGERVVFRVAADRETPARLWVEEPGGTSVIVETDAGPVPRDIGDPQGLLGYRFDSPGRHVFHLTGPSGERGPAIRVEVE